MNCVQEPTGYKNTSFRVRYCWRNIALPRLWKTQGSCFFIPGRSSAQFFMGVARLGRRHGWGGCRRCAGCLHQAQQSGPKELAIHEEISNCLLCHRIHLLGHCPLLGGKPPKPLGLPESPWAEPLVYCHNSRLLLGIPYFLSVGHLQRRLLAYPNSLAGWNYMSWQYCRCNLRNDQDPQATGQRFIWGFALEAELFIIRPHLGGFRHKTITYGVGWHCFMTEST